MISKFNTMKLFLLIINIIPLISLGQQEITEQVVDRDTNQPLEKVSTAVKDKSKGTTPFRKKAIKVEKRNHSTIRTYSIDTIEFLRITNTKLVLWELEKSQTKIFVPLDSIIDHLTEICRHIIIGRQGDKLKDAINYLQNNQNTDTVFLSREIKEKIGDDHLTDIVIKMINYRSIKILDSANQPIPFIVR